MAKPKKCKVCKGEFEPVRFAQTVCGPVCAWALPKQKAVKERKRQTKADVRALREKDRSWHLKKAQAAFNAFIRARDAGEPCISCQRHHKGQYHAGHYFTVGAHPELRFEELNNHKQCSACNNHLSGNIAEYRKHLLIKIGQDKLDWLEGPHKAKKYTIDEIKEITETYKQKLKDLKND